MSKNFRKEGQPEKERIAKITGMDIDKAGLQKACMYMYICTCTCVYM